MENDGVLRLILVSTSVYKGFLMHKTYIGKETKKQRLREFKRAKTKNSLSDFQKINIKNF